MSADELGGRILIAEDDDHTRNLLKEVCEGSGFEVVAVSDGEQAVAALSGRPDLILLDLMMPKLDGFAVLTHLRGQPETKEVPVILLTAIADVEGKCKGMELGADDYVTKPFRLIELQTRIRAALSVRRYRDRLRVAEEQLEQLRAADPITGMGTYPQLKSGLEYEVARARRYGRPLATVVVGIDDYSQLRADLGRQETDKLVAGLAGLLRDQLRDADRLYRIDDDEFVVVLPETDEAGAVHAGGRILKLVGEKAATLSEGRTVSVSIGASAVPQNGEVRPDDLVRLAHQALEESRTTAPGTLTVRSAG